MAPPLVSIITPTYRRKDPGVLRRTLSTVQTQTYANWEHLICSDGEHEAAAAAVVDGFADPRRSYLVSARHYGGYGAGVRQEVMNGRAAGAYYLFLDDDNILFPDYLEKMVDALGGAQNGERFAICRILHFGPVRQDVGRPPLYLRGDPRLCFIDTLQVLVEARAMKEVGWVRPEHYCSDGYTYEELGRRFTYVRVEECLGVHL